MGLFTFDVIFGLIAVASCPILIIEADRRGWLGQPENIDYTNHKE